MPLPRATFRFSENGRPHTAEFIMHFKGADVDRVQLKVHPEPQTVSAPPVGSLKATGRLARVVQCSSNEIIQRFLRGRGQRVVLTGAGISKEAGVPTLFDMQSAVGLYESGFVQRAADSESRKEIETSWKRVMNEAIRATEKVPETHTVLTEFVSSHDMTLATTNQDGLHDRSVFGTGVRYLRSDTHTEQQFRDLVKDGQPLHILLYGTSGHLSEDSNWPVLST